MRELKHLSEIYKSYDTFLIDLWGVIHNGVVLNANAVEVVDQLKNNSKKVVFLSNAPRPSSKVVDFLLKMNLNKKYLSYVMTSGEAAMHAINQNKFGKTFFHLGPHRDTSLFEKQKDNKTEKEKCDFIYKNSKKIVFLSNAPRPSSKVISFLLKMKMDKKYLTNVITFGEPAM